MVNTDFLSIKSEDSRYYDYIGLAVLGCFAVYVIGWYLQIGTRWGILGRIRFEFLIAGFLAIIAVVLHRQRKVAPSGLLYVVLAYFAVCVLSFIFTPSFSRSWFVFLTYVIKYAFFAFFVYEFVREPRALKIFIIALFLAWLKMGQEGMYGVLTGGMMWMNQGVMRLHGTTGFYFHPNSFSGFAVGTLPFIYYYLPIVKKIPRLLLLLQLVFSLNIILFTGSRTGYVAFAGLILYSIFAARKKVKFFTVTAFLVLILATQIPTDYVERFQSIFTGEEKAGQSTEKRKEILRDAWSIFKEHPLGVGIGAFPDVRQQKFGRDQDTHNLYLQIATNLGVQGLVVFFALIYLITKRLSFVERNSEEQLLRMSPTKMKPLSGENSMQKRMVEHYGDVQLLKATAQAMKMFLFARLVLGLFGHDLYEIYWWFLIGTTAALFYIVQVCERKTRDLVADKGVQ